MPITVDDTLHAQGETILQYIRTCLGPACRQNAFVSIERPAMTSDSIVVWRSGGPTEEGFNPAVRMLTVDWTVSVATCCQPVKRLTPNGQVRIPNTADLGKAAKAHNRDVATITGLLSKRLGAIFGARRALDIRTVSVQAGSSTELGCVTDEIVISGVPWRPIPCGTC
jgi:hypothetical protein